MKSIPTPLKVSHLGPSYKNSIIKKLQQLPHKYKQASSQVQKEHFWKSIPRKVAPTLIQEYSDHIVINQNILVKSIIIGVPHFGQVGYPKKMSARLIDELLSLSTAGFTIAYSFCIIPIDPNRSMRMLDDALYYNEVNQQAYKKSNENQTSHELELDRSEYLELYNNLHKGEQKLFHTAFIILIWASNEQELRTAEGMVKSILEANRVTYEVPLFSQLETFIAAQPYPVSTDKAWRELTSNACASLVGMRNPNSRTDDIGLLFGEDKKTGKSIIVNLKALAAQHLMFVGPTGSGKTFTLLMLLMRAHDMLGKRIIYTTPKPDATTNYRAVAEYYGDMASIVDIGPSGKNINPLQIMYDAQALGSNQADYIRVFDDHLELLDQFFSVLFEGTKTINMSSYINETLIKCYRNKGIIREDPETWKDVQWPTLLDLRSIWEEDAKDPRDVTAKALVDKTFKVNTSWSYMNRQSDVDLSRDFIIVDISNVPTSLQEAMNVFVTGIMGMRFRTDTKKETIIAVDESRVFLLNPKLASFMIRTLTQGRSFNIALWLATQQTGDLIKANLEDEFKTNISISIILGNMRADTIEHVRSFYKLNEMDIQNLMGCGVGEGLLLVGSEVIPAKFKATQFEMDIIKGKIKNGNKNQPADVSYKLVHPELYSIVQEHKVCFDDWIEGDASMMTQYGFESQAVHRALGGTGLLRIWYRPEIVEDNRVKNQSMDHYSTVLQICGFLTKLGIKATVNHYDDVDIIAEKGDIKIAFEYERPGSHTKDQLIEKKLKAETKYGRVVFIGTVENIKDLMEAVGTDCVVRRGSLLGEMIYEIFKLKN